MIKRTVQTLIEITTPTAPANGFRHFYAQAIGLFWRDSIGTERQLGTLDGTETLTNKRVTKRIGTTTSSATPTPNGDSNDMFTVTGLTLAATFGAPTGTPTIGQELLLRIKDDGTARALTFNAIYRFSSDLVAPTTTIISKTLYMKFIYNFADTKWDCVAWLSNF